MSLSDIYSEDPQRRRSGPVSLPAARGVLLPLHGDRERGLGFLAFITTGSAFSTQKARGCPTISAANPAIARPPSFEALFFDLSDFFCPVKVFSA
jgi:hypothetical protein